MSLLPFIENSYHFTRPKLAHQHFGITLDPEDFYHPLTVPIASLSHPAGYLRPWKSQASEQDAGSTIHVSTEGFEAHLDVAQFKPEEVTVKMIGGNIVMVEGNHEEKEDEHGYISRHFVRKYVLPSNCDIMKVKCKLSTDGVLTITAPKHGIDDAEHRHIPIEKTGEPAKKSAAKPEK